MLSVILSLKLCVFSKRWTAIFDFPRFFSTSAGHEAGLEVGVWGKVPQRVHIWEQIQKTMAGFHLGLRLGWEADP